jgi:hypothetical protein
MVLRAEISPGDEQYVGWWQQFRDVVSPHQHDQGASTLQISDSCSWSVSFASINANCFTSPGPIEQSTRAMGTRGSLQYLQSYLHTSGNIHPESSATRVRTRARTEARVVWSHHYISIRVRTMNTADIKIQCCTQVGFT